MKREIELRLRLRSLRALGDTVSAMKSLSAHHFREARRATEPAHLYREGVERILGWTSATLAAGDGARGLVVIGAELGLCGSYNAQVVAAAARRREELGRGPTLCVGHRAAVLLQRRSIAIEKTYPAPTSVQGITTLLLALAEDLLGAYAAERLSSFDIVSSRFGGVGAEAPRSTRLLPFEPQPTGAGRRARFVTQEQLGLAVIREILFITLYDLLLDALASEHGARLVATQAAEKWLDERIAKLGRHLAATRREASTQEVIEIAAGGRARLHARQREQRRADVPRSTS